MEGRLLAFPLSSFSHLTSLARQQPGDRSAPEKRPATIHLKSGDFYVMEESYETWAHRISGRQDEMMTAAFQVARGK